MSGRRSAPSMSWPRTAGGGSGRSLAICLTSNPCVQKSWAGGALLMGWKGGRGAYWHMLFTHCGIVGTRFAGRNWVAEPVLDDGNGNPPTGWGNPFQPGVMTLTSQDHAEFKSRNGELEATFRPRTPADPPAQPCD